MDLARAYRWIGAAYSALPRRLGRGFALPPLRVAFILTHRCNLRCAMCNVWNCGPGEEDQELDTGELLRGIRQVPPTALITFTGGEPFVRRDIWTLIDQAAGRRRLHLVTNGTLLKEEGCHRLARLGSRSLLGSGLLSLGLSLEGPAESHDRIVQVPGSFDRTMATLRAVAAERRRLGRRYPYLDLKVVITADNLDDLVPLFQLAETEGADLVSYQMENTQGSAYGVMDGRERAHLEPPPPVEPIDADRLGAVIRELQERAQHSPVKVRFNPNIPVTHLQDRYQNRFSLDGYGCSIAWTVMHVGPYGHIFPCYSYPMGNIRDNSLLRIWNDEPYRRFRRALTRDRIWPGCVGCCVMRYHGPEATL